MFRRLRGYFAEFLLNDSLIGLYLLDSLTGVGLGTVIYCYPHGISTCLATSVDYSCYPSRVWHRFTSVSFAYIRETLSLRPTSLYTGFNTDSH